MSASTDFNYDDILSLEKAKLVNRVRLNFLGSQEMVIDYNGVSSAMREEATEWLEENSRGIDNPLVNPSFGFKTYTGSWNCIDITYNEDKKVIRQRFKIDSSLGDLDGSGGSMTGSGDLGKVSAGETIERAYYWRVVDPDSVELPPTAPNGTIYTKSAQDNGDGTYDVVITKQVAINLSATSSIQSGGEAYDTYPGAYTEYIETSTSNTEQAFVTDGGTIPNAVVGQIKRVDNVPLEDGTFRTTITTREAIAQRIPPDSAAGGPNYPWFEYGSDYIQDANNIIVGRNQPWWKVVEDRDRTNVSPALFKINSMSVRVNDYGLFDYSIISNTPG
jgi:hypothetical protein